MFKTSMNIALLLLVALQIIMSLAWLEMLTFNAAAKQFDILRHQAWKVSRGQD